VARTPLQGVAVVPYASLYGGHTVYRVEQDRLRAVAVEPLGEAGGKPPRMLVRGAELKEGDRLLATHLPNAVSGLKVEVIQ
jgi:HlyD family secretion protein